MLFCWSMQFCSSEVLLYHLQAMQHSLESILHHCTITLPSLYIHHFKDFVICDFVMQSLDQKCWTVHDVVKTQMFLGLILGKTSPIFMTRPFNLHFIDRQRSHRTGRTLPHTTWLFKLTIKVKWMDAKEWNSNFFFLSKFSTFFLFCFHLPRSLQFSSASK